MWNVESKKYRLVVLLLECDVAWGDKWGSGGVAEWDDLRLGNAERQSFSFGGIL
jgi:hypothetical protein